jgi:translation initiation factor 5-like protein/translation initiation factor 5A-like protein
LLSILFSFLASLFFIYTHFHLNSYQEPYRKYVDAQIDVKDKSYDRNFNTIGPAAGGFDSATLDVTERQFREGTRPIVAEPAENRFGVSAQAFREESRFEGSTVDGPVRDTKLRVTERTSRTTVDPPKFKRDMGYYDDDGHYHSIRRGVQRVAERIAHPIHGPSLFRHHHHHHGHHEGGVEREEVIIKKEREVDAPESRYYGETIVRETPVERQESSCRTMTPNTITIPCHHIRIGDLLILQGRPCQVIRITTSAQTGQHRYLGVDLFTKQLHEESSFISNPAPSVIVQNMLGPVFKQYRVLDIRDDGSIVAMSDSGNIKQSLPVLDQSGLHQRLSKSFDDGRGSIRVLVLSDEGQELVVDYKIVHGSRL